MAAPASPTPRPAPSTRRARRQARVTAYLDGRLDAEDMARAIIGFRGVAVTITPTMRYVRRPADGEACAYVFDENSGMVYILD